MQWILVKKLGFLRRVMASDSDNLSGSVVCNDNLSGERVKRDGGVFQRACH